MLQSDDEDEPDLETREGNPSNDNTLARNWVWTLLLTKTSPSLLFRVTTSQGIEKHQPDHLETVPRLTAPNYMLL